MMWTSVILIASDLASFIAKSLLVIRRTDIAKLLLTICQSDVAKFTLRLEDILSLSSNDRICSFNWIRGSKHCFLTSFSNLNCYFLLLVFSRNSYLLVSLLLSWLHGNPISLPVFIPFVLRIPRRTCAPIFLAHMMHFLEARRLWEPGTRISTGFLSPFRLSPKDSHATSVRRSRIIPFLLTQNFRANIFSRDISLRQVNAVQLGKGIPKGFPNSWIKVDCCLSDDSFWTTSQALFTLDCIPDGSLHFVPFDSADLPCYKILCSGFLNGPLPFGTFLEVSSEERHTFGRL